MALICLHTRVIVYTDTRVIAYTDTRVSLFTLAPLTGMHGALAGLDLQHGAAAHCRLTDERRVRDVDADLALKVVVAGDAHAVQFVVARVLQLGLVVRALAANHLSVGRKKSTSFCGSYNSAFRENIKRKRHK